MATSVRKPRRSALAAARRQATHQGRLRGAANGRERFDVARDYLLAVLARLDEQARDVLAGRAADALTRLAEERTS